MIVRAGHAQLACNDSGERDRNLVASVRAALPRHGDLPRRTTAHRRLPGAGALPRPADVVVGGGASAVQFLGELAPVTETLWVTRREPVWRTDEFTPDAGRAAVALVEDRVRSGSAAGECGQRDRSRPARAGARGRTARRYRRRPMFTCGRTDRRAFADGTLRAGRRSSSGPPASGRPSAISHRCSCARSTAASSSTAPRRSPIRGCSSSGTGRRRAPSARTGPAGSPPAESPAGSTGTPSKASTRRSDGRAAVLTDLAGCTTGERRPGRGHTLASVAGRISEADRERVRDASRIEQVVGEYVALRNAGGGNLKGLCPFHDEKTPVVPGQPRRGATTTASAAGGRRRLRVPAGDRAA